MAAMSSALSGTAAGVPFLAMAPPGGARRDTAVVVAWHLMDPPRTEEAFAAALPLAGLDAWRIYLGLPLCGQRLPLGGHQELMALGYEDAVMNLQGPIAEQGAAEFPAAFADLQQRLDLGQGPLGVMGGSMGSAVAQLVIAESAPAAGLHIAAGVLVSPIIQLAPVVEATARRFGITYPWGPASREVADRLDFITRADQVRAHGQPAMRAIVGANDDQDGFVIPAQRWQAGLAARYDDPARVDLVTIPDMAHALADPPGDRPAPQSRHAATVDRHAAHWFHRHLTNGPATPGPLDG